MEQMVDLGFKLKKRSARIHNFNHYTTIQPCHTFVCVCVCILYMNYKVFCMVLATEKHLLYTSENCNHGNKDM